MWPFKKKAEAPKYQPNPHLKVKSASGFFSTDVERVLTGWDTDSYSIDHYLKSELTKIVARSRRWARTSSTGKKFVSLMKSNIVGPSGIQVSAQRMTRTGTPDSRSNQAVEAAWKDWCESHCDFHGRASFIDITNMAIACASQDGEFFFEKRQSGKYNFQLRAIDAQLLDIDKYEQTANGEIRLGVEYDRLGRVTYYHFKEKSHLGDYRGGRSYKIRADRIIHGFIPEYPDQSRGIPWPHAALEAAKHLDKYKEGAIINARAAANSYAVISSEPGDEYTASEEGTDYDLDSIGPGEIRDIGNRRIQAVDPDYPHQMYDPFVTSQLRDISAGLNVSYHSLSNDLSNVNFSSIRAGVLEDRELYKMLQNWLIRVFIKPVFEEWVGMAYMSGKIVLSGGQPVNGPVETYTKASFQGRRWAWVDPQKDMNANKMYIDERLKSRSQIMREQGDDPQEVWAEIAQEEEYMARLGIQPIPKDGMANDNQEGGENA